jgi:hypothetical protein
VRLLTQEVLSHGIVDRVGRETIRELLVRHGLEPWKPRGRAAGWPHPIEHATHTAA